MKIKDFKNSRLKGLIKQFCKTELEKIAADNLHEYYLLDEITDWGWITFYILDVDALRKPIETDFMVKALIAVRCYNLDKSEGEEPPRTEYSWKNLRAEGDCGVTDSGLVFSEWITALGECGEFTFDTSHAQPTCQYHPFGKRDGESGVEVACIKILSGPASPLIDI